MRSVSHKVIYIVLQFSVNYAVRFFFFLRFFADFERRIGASEIFEHQKMGKIHTALSKLRLTM